MNTRGVIRLVRGRANDSLQGSGKNSRSGHSNGRATSPKLYARPHLASVA